MQTRKWRSIQMAVHIASNLTDGWQHHFSPLDCKVVFLRKTWSLRGSVGLHGKGTLLRNLEYIAKIKRGIYTA